MTEKINTGFPIAKGSVEARHTSFDALQNLSTPARAQVNAEDVVVPEGYEVQPVMAGLSFPMDIAFAVVEQLGLALGIPRLVDLAFHVTTEKSTDQLLLQEFGLEICSFSILYRKNI